MSMHADKAAVFTGSSSGAVFCLAEACRARRLQFHRLSAISMQSTGHIPDNMDKTYLGFVLRLQTQTNIVLVMAHLTASVEYGIHCLLWLVDFGDTPLSSRELAELQGISPSFLAKIFPKLEKAGIVCASEGVRGGYVLAKDPQDISFLKIVDAIEDKKPLFDCQEIRIRCPLFGKAPPGWATTGTCAIHAVMLRAEKAMRDELASQSLADIALVVRRKAPHRFTGEVRDWIDDRVQSRSGKLRHAKVRVRRRS